MAVSAFYHRKLNARHVDESVKLEEWALKILPRICMWVTIRYLLFTGTLSDRSTIFWYHEALADPLDWHHRFLDSVGLHLPSSLVRSAKDAALRQKFPFGFKGIDRHSEGSSQEVMPGRSWEEEVGVETAEAMEKVIRVWLPPVLLAKLGVPLV